MNKKYIRALSIATTDSGGGAGTQADLKTFTALGCFGMSVITALTAQNTIGVQMIHPLPAKFIQAQINSIITDIGVDAIKIGMLERAEIIHVVAENMKYLQCPIVLDPVMFAKGGTPLISSDAIPVMRDILFPHVTLLTPNIPEAEYIAECKIITLEDMKSAAIKISRYGVKNVLVKGGHRIEKKCIDVLYQSDKHSFTYFSSKRIVTQNTHGTGCTLSAAIAAELGKGKELSRAIFSAKTFLFKAIQSGQHYKIGRGNGPVNHQWRY
ncbi:MAG: bifunctional hydroxymethylpyrimidine kinase/phosphomethylpyrimidine kinase [Gammaproteobacteria bacterium]|nr:bifunctional hydroxymethylpyrimidine kinase/phosphomethylpyrimidine kinase [Gammaproteobacteria bacterium]